MICSPVHYVLLSSPEFLENLWAAEGKAVTAEIFATRSDRVQTENRQEEMDLSWEIKHPTSLHYWLLNH